ncbi:MAG: SDR family oxidoreductase [Planctomycetaceae bacterium]|nr:SDR family oxidoreductase [Planctomycetales bacterium]MCB9927362.1 SDR family oxidoreductase [Planctomycetaceae bacterium]
MSDYTLLTGCTGLLGRYLVRDLLLDGHRLAVLARPSRKESASARVEGIMQMWEQQCGMPLPRPVCLEGDVGQPGLGLSSSDRAWVAANCTSMLHSAASLTFHADGSGEPYNTNVIGTKNVLDLCADLDVGNMHYVSTAYVCGLREERVMEEDLDFGQRFRNDYEMTKLEAEKLVRSAGFLKQLTVYRPAVIAGDSCTGYTNTYHGLYMYLKLMSVLVWNTEPGPDGVRHTPVQLEMTGDEPRNIIPVDWVSAVMCHLLGTPEAHGNTFHLAPEIPLTPRQIIEAGYVYFNSRGVEFVGPTPSSTPISEMDEDARQNMGMYREYEGSDPEFDLTNLQKHAPHLPCPVIDDAMLHRFWKYGEDDRWGKRRPKRLDPYRSIEEHCADLVVKSQSKLDPKALKVNFRVLGPGGGDWHLHIQSGRLTRFERGLSSESDASLQIDSKVFWQLTSEHKDFSVDSASESLDAPSDCRVRTLTELCSALFGVSVRHEQIVSTPTHGSGSVDFQTQADKA